MSISLNTLKLHNEKLDDLVDELEQNFGWKPIHPKEDINTIMYRAGQASDRLYKTKTNRRGNLIMCLGGGAPPTPPPLPPAPPPPLPPTPTAPPPDPIVKDVNPQVKRAKDDRGNKNKNQYSKGTGDLRIKLNPKVNTGTGGAAGGGGIN